MLYVTKELFVFLGLILAAYGVGFFNACVSESVRDYFFRMYKRTHKTE